MNGWRILPAFVLAAFVCTLGIRAEEKDKKKEEPKKKKGTVVGVLTAKEKNWIEVKAAGETKARRYVPHWRGGAPAAGGGLDKKMLATFATLKVGSRVRIEWVFEERLRVEKIEVLKKAGDKDKTEKDKKEK